MKKEYYKNVVDFQDTYLDLNMKYHIIGYNFPVEKNQRIILDLCIWENKHTFIDAYIEKVFNNQFVCSFRYIEEVK